jgi:serine/threonine-protein kinase
MSAEEARAKLAQARQLAAHGDRAAARSLLASLGAGPEARQARAQLALLDEEEGKLADAAAGWERVLAEDINDSTAWAQLDRLRGRLARPVEKQPSAGQTLIEPEGVTWSRYELVREIGRGATSTVYLARDRTLKIELALKVLHTSSASGEDWRRFFNEARLAAALRHPGVVAIYDLDQDTQTLVMEYLSGGSLRERLVAARPAGLPADSVFSVALSLLDTLAHVHAAGIVHGDITPRNILFRESGQPVLADFGSARLLAGLPSEQAGGTPIYLAPEVLAGEPSTPASDLFSLGAVLWEALTAKPIRVHADLMSGRLATGDLPAGIAQVHPNLAALVSALTQREPDRRWVGVRHALGR